MPKNSEKLTLTQKELLIRIDERQKNILDEIRQIKDNQKDFVIDDEQHKDLIKKVNILWDMRNKIFGYSAAMGAIGALVFQLILKFWPN